MTDFRDLNAIETALFVRIEVPEYRLNENDPGSPVVLTFSDFYRDTLIDGELYQSLGDLVSITSVSNELRVSSGEVSIAISGIPLSRLKEIDQSTIKGSKVAVRRGINAPDTSEFLLEQTQGRFFGIVNNFSLQEEFDPDGRVAANTIIFQCSSIIDVLSRYRTGRRTASSDMKRYFPEDTSFDRVTTLDNNIFDFGVPK